VPGDRTRFYRRIDAHPLAVRDSLRELRGSLAPLGLSPDQLATLEMVMAEVLNNIVEHAYRETIGGVIHMSVVAGRDGVCCHICDSGMPMPDGGLPNGACVGSDTPLGRLPEGGFGWFMIRALCTDLVYRRIAGRNSLRLRIDIGRPAPKL
jgi:serine/threonine-protein kinase RsbW